MKHLLLLGLALLGFFTGFSQKVFVKDEIVYRDSVPYCRMVRTNTSFSSPRFSFQTLAGKVFALTQHKPAVGYVIYFPEPDTLIPIAPQIPYANSLAGMIVQHDVLANGAPDAQAIRRFALLEGRPDRPSNSERNDVSNGLDTLFRPDRTSRLSGPAPCRFPLTITSDRIYRHRQLLATYSIRRFSEAGAAYKTILIAHPDGRTVAEADLPAFNAASCTLRLPESHATVELPVPDFPQTEQVKQIVQYLCEQAHL